MVSVKAGLGLHHMSDYQNINPEYRIYIKYLKLADVPLRQYKLNINCYDLDSKHKLLVDLTYLLSGTRIM